MDDYITSLLPDTETSISMVREIRTRLYDENSIQSPMNHDNIPVKVDVETLYILEQKCKKSSFPSVNNMHDEYHCSTGLDQNDFSTQTTTSRSTLKPSNQPISTQVDSAIEQSTVAAQTADSLHRSTKEQQCLLSPEINNNDDDDENRVIRTTTTTTRYEMKRRHSSHHTSEDENDLNDVTNFIYTENEDTFQTETHPISDNQFKSEQQQQQHVQDINRNIIHHRTEQKYPNEDEHRSSEVYEIHTRGACKCLVISNEEETQYGTETSFEKQLRCIERTYTDEDLKSTELHIIVTSSDENYQLVRRDYALRQCDDNNDVIHERLRYPSITISYYTKDGHRMRIEQGRRLENLPLFIRCEIEYELNHYGM